MDSNSWDIFCDREISGALWAGFNLAQSLATRVSEVRLFTNGVSELSVAQPGVEPELWMQHVAGMQIADMRLASWCAPARHLVQAFGSGVVASYLARFTSQSRQGLWFDMALPWAAPESSQPLNPVETTSSYCTYLAKIGDLPPCGGYIKQPMHALAPLDRWSLRRGRPALMNLLGLPAHLLDRDTPVFASTQRADPVERWLHTMYRDGPPMVVFVPAGKLQEQLSPTLALTPSATGTVSIGSLTVVFLPLLAWSTLDELISCCELVLTDEADVMLRACAAGIPPVWIGDSALAHRTLNWCTAASSGQARTVLAAAWQATSTGEGMASAWRDLLTDLKVVQQAAAAVGTRMQRAPDIADVLNAGSQAASYPSPYPLETMFAPTESNGQFLS